MLTSKKRYFAEAMLAGKSQTESAKSAGYSEKTAKQAGYKLAKDNEIQEYIERKKQKIEESKPEIEKKIAAIISSKQRYLDPLDFLKDLMNDESEDLKLRFEAAKTMMPFLHSKPAEQGKKESKKDKANDVAKGRFSPSAPPALKVVK